MFKRIKDENIFFINIIIFLSIVVLFFKFFILADFYPMHDEIVVVERNTEWQNFLWRNYTSNHTLNSLLAVIIKSIFGYNLLFYRFISFLSFVGILFLFRKLYPNLLIFSLLIIFILTSNILTNYIWIFRGYYIWAFLTVLNFYFLKSFFNNFIDNKNFKFLMIVNLLLCCHSLFVLYNVVPILLVLLFFIFKNQDKDKFFIFMLWFILPSILFYLVVIILEGFTIVYWDNLNINFLLSNISNIIKTSFVPGFKNIFFTQHFNQYNNDTGYLFYEVFNKLLNPPYEMESEYTIILIYILSFILFTTKIFIKKINYLDFVYFVIIIFFYIINKNPEPRVHIGIAFFMILYISEFIWIFIKKSIIPKILGYFLCLICLFLIFNTNINHKYFDTKLTMDKINRLSVDNDCEELNRLLNDYEIFILKNLHKYSCDFYYDYKLKKNILTN